MIKDSNYERVYTGSEINVNHVKNRLEEAGIGSVVRNDQDSALRAGFGSTSDYANQALLFVEKENLVKARFIVEKTFAESELTDAELEKEATKSRLAKSENTSNIDKGTLFKKEDKPKRSMLNIGLNIALLLYSLWRLYPLTQGEELPTFRIVLSSLIALFCAYTLFNHFRK